MEGYTVQYHNRRCKAMQCFKAMLGSTRPQMAVTTLSRWNCDFKFNLNQFLLRTFFAPFVTFFVGFGTSFVRFGTNFVHLLEISIVIIHPDFANTAERKHTRYNLCFQTEHRKKTWLSFFPSQLHISNFFSNFLEKKSRS